MTTVCTRTIAFLLIGIVASLVGPPAWAESITVYHTDFSDTPTGEMPAGWVVMDTEGTWEVDENDQLILSEATDDSSIVCDAAGVLTDYTVSATFQFESGRSGLVGRLQDEDSYYMLRLRDNRRFELMWVGPNDTYGTLGYLTVSSNDWAPGNWITMSMAFDGSEISGELRNAGDEVIGTLVREDSRYDSGKAGLRADSLTYACSEFTITAIPEPGTVALLISVLAGLLIVRRKR